MRFLTALLVLSITTSAAAAEKRVALVVGQSAYQSVSALPNPSRDAAAVSASLEKAGFKVLRASDRSLSGLRTDIDAFVKEVQQAGPGATALFFYAGHGVQRDGNNYLLPVDAKIAKDEDVPKQALAFSHVLKRLDTTGATTKILVLDACRDNPFAEAASGMAKGLAVVLASDAGAPRGEAGLARVEAKSGTFVAYSTSPGATASDGSGENSPYASALLKVMLEPGIPVEQVFKRVRVAVHETTSGVQTPWEISSLTGNFVFVAGAALEESPAAARVFSKNRPTRTLMVGMGADESYRLAVAWDAPEVYRIFLDTYSDDSRALAVHRSLGLRNQELSWAEAVRENTADGYAAFLRLYPDSLHTAEARRLRALAPQRNLQTAAICLPGQNLNPNQPRIPAREQRRTEKKRSVEKTKVVKQRPPPRRRVVQEEVVEDAPVVRRRQPPAEVVEDRSGADGAALLGSAISIGIGIGGMRGGGGRRHGPVHQSPGRTHHPN